MNLPLLPPYWGASDFECGLSPYCQSSEGPLPLLTLDVGYLLSAAHHSSTVQPPLTAPDSYPLILLHQKADRLKTTITEH